MERHDNVTSLHGGEEADVTLASENWPAKPVCGLMTCLGACHCEGVAHGSGW